MFATEAQRKEACETLLRFAHIDPAKFFDRDGVTLEAIKIAEGSATYLSSGERIVVGVAVGIWNAHTSPPFHDVFYRLDKRLTWAIGELMAACTKGPPSIEAWIKKHGNS